MAAEHASGLTCAAFFFRTPEEAEPWVEPLAETVTEEVGIWEMPLEHMLASILYYRLNWIGESIPEGLVVLWEGTPLPLTDGAPQVLKSSGDALSKLAEKFCEKNNSSLPEFASFIVCRDFGLDPEETMEMFLNAEEATTAVFPDVEQ